MTILEASHNGTRHGWRPIVVTSVCFALATLAWGTVFYGHSVYMDALMRAHGWSAATVSGGVFVFWLAALPGTLAVGILVDRFGPPLVVCVGGLSIAFGLIALGWLDQTWQMYIAYAALGFGYPALAAAAISATLVPWFTRGFGTALGVALTGASLGGAVIPVVVVRFNEQLGFAPTMAVVGGGLLIVVMLLAMVLALIGRPAEVSPRRPDEPVFSMSGRLRSPLFWTIAIAGGFGLGGQVGFLGHQVPILVQHVDQTTASLMVTMVAGAAALGRLVVGLLSRFLASGHLAALSYCIYGAGITVLVFANTAASLFFACALTGLFVGAIVMLPPILVRETFGAVGFGRTAAMVNAVMYAFVGVTTWSVGLLKDFTGGYDAGLWLLVVMEVLAMLLVLTLPRPAAQTE